MSEEQSKDTNKIGLVGLNHRGITISTIDELKHLENKSNVVFVAAPVFDSEKQQQQFIENIAKAEVGNKKIVIVAGDVANRLPHDKRLIVDKSFLDLSLGSELNPYLISKLPEFPDFSLGTIPNKLQWLRNLDLSPEQFDYIKNSPEHRMDNETFEEYKKRRMLNKLIIKYRGDF